MKAVNEDLGINQIYISINLVLPCREAGRQADRQTDRQACMQRGRGQGRREGRMGQAGRERERETGIRPINIISCVTAIIGISVADPGGGGVQGVRTSPLLGHDVGFLTLGPKLDPPPFFACRPKMDPSGGSRVCVSVTGVITTPPPWNVDDVTRTMSKGGCACTQYNTIQ